MISLGSKWEWRGQSGTLCSLYTSVISLTSTAPGNCTSSSPRHLIFFPGPRTGEVGEVEQDTGPPGIYSLPLLLIPAPLSWIYPLIIQKAGLGGAGAKDRVCLQDGRDTVSNKHQTSQDRLDGKCGKMNNLPNSHTRLVAEPGLEPPSLDS